MWSKRFLMAGLAIAVGLWDACVVPWMPGWWSVMQAGLAFTVILAIFSSPERWMIGAIVAGGVADVILPSNAGFMPLRFLLVGAIIFYLSQRLFTNRSLMSVVLLSGCAVVIDRFLLRSMEFLQAWMERSVTVEVHPPIALSFVWSCALGAGIFFIFVLFSKRFLPLITIGRASRRMGRVRL